MIEAPASPRARLAWLTTVPTAAAAGALLAVNPVAALLTAAFAMSLALLALGRGVVGLFVSALALVLAGYMFMGRGFAHVGVPPMYVGELALALAVFALVTAFATRRLRAVQIL
ncbi:MAG TPA: hypothetical protein VMM78_03870, partial [Thermomicrobiales bacterium]|nr:hypothetical protein [Thermomicrobiales bacterium]